MDDEGNGMARMLGVGAVFEISVVTGYHEGFGLGIERREKRSQELIELVEETLWRLIDAPVSHFVGEEIFEEGEGMGPVNGGEVRGGLFFRARCDVELKTGAPAGGREICRHSPSVAEGGDVSQFDVGSSTTPRRDGLSTSGRSKVLRGKRVGERDGSGVGREQPLDLMEEIVLVDHVVRGRVGKRPEVTSHSLCTVHTGEKRGLAGTTLGEALYAESCIEGADEVMLCIVFGQMTSPVLSIAESKEGLPLVLGEGICGVGGAETDSVEEDKHNSAHEARRSLKSREHVRTRGRRRSRRGDGVQKELLFCWLGDTLWLRFPGVVTVDLVCSTMLFRR